MNKVKTPQWEAQTTNSWKQDCINITSNNHYTLFPWYWDSKIKEYLISYFCSLFLSLFFLMPSSLLSSPLFYRPSPFLIPPAGLLLVGSFWDIFPSSIGFPSILIIKQDFWGVFVLFKLSYMYLMWQRLGGEPLTNAKVVVSVILILLGSFPRCT